MEREDRERGQTKKTDRIGTGRGDREREGRGRNIWKVEGKRR